MVEVKYTKSATNQKTQSEGLAVLLQDPRIQYVSPAIKKEIVSLLPVKGAFGPQTFDAVMADEPIGAITLENLSEVMAMLRLVEMKTTKAPIRNSAINGFFYGATEREYAMASALGDRYLFAFVVLNEQNDYGRHFFVLLPLSEVEKRTRAKRVQYQVNFRNDLSPDPEFPPLP